MRLAAPLGLALAALLVAPVSGFGAVTIGSNLNAAGSLTNIADCAGSTACTYGQVAPLPASHTASGGLTSPIDGVVTKWRIKAGSAGGPVKLRVLQPSGGAGGFTAHGTSGVETTVSGTAEFPASVRIGSGDYLGVDNASDALIFAPTNGASAYYWNPPLSDGTNRTATGTVGSRELMVQADVEPDVDCDGKGDETQDPNTGDGPCKQGGGGDTTAPVITALAANPAAFRTKGKKRGTTFSYTLSEAAQVAFTIERRQTGRRVGGQCVKQTKANRKRKRCTRFVLVGSLAQQGKAGKNAKRFSGRIAKKALKPGRYRATLVATDAAGNASAPRRVSFRVRP